MSHVAKVFALLLGSALLMFAGGLQGLLISIRGGAEGFSLLALGLIGTSWSVGYIAGTLLVPHMVTRVGHIRSFSVMASIASMVILLNLMFIEQTWWIILRAASGFCFAGAAMIVESWLNEVTDSSHRGTVYSSYMMGNFAFSTVGQMVISVTGVESFLPFVIGALGFSLAVLPTALTVSTQPRPLARAKLDLKLLIRTSPIAVLAAFGSGMAAGTFGTLAPVYGIQTGLPSATIAYLMSLAVVVSAMGQVPIGRLSDRIDRRYVLIAVSMTGALAGGLMVIFNPHQGWLIWGLFALYGLGANSVYPIAAAHANDSAQEGEFALIASGLILLFGMGLAVGPVLGALAMAGLSPVALFSVTALVHATIATVALYRIQVRDRPARADREDFQVQMAVRTTTVQTLVLDPRIEADEFLDEVTEPEDIFVPPEMDENGGEWFPSSQNGAEAQETQSETEAEKQSATM